MNSKKILSTILAASMTMSIGSMFSVAVSALDSGKGPIPFPSVSNVTSASTLASSFAVLSDDSSEPEIGVTDTFTANSSFGSLSLDGITPNQTIYINLGADGFAYSGNILGGRVVYAEDLGNSNLFSVRVDDRTGTGKTLFKSATLVGNKSLNGSVRSSWLKLVVAETTSTSEQQAKATIELKARKDATVKNGAHPSSNFKSGDLMTAQISLWISNQAHKGDSDVNTGDRVYFDPAKNDTNVIVWGDDRAALKFDADSDTSKFYGRLSTKNNSEIYATYGDPVNADLWFYDFVSNPTIPSTSRATLTLGIPWEDDDTYVPDPAQCFIYQMDADGNLTDVTSLFTFSEDDQEIPGWSIRTRQLGTYVISDAELDIEVIDEEEDLTDDVIEDVTPAPTDKVIPDTGASDMVNVAVAAAIVSLAAAGAVAFKKASK